jgi:hypothetical protein
MFRIEENRIEDKTRPAGVGARAYICAAALSTNITLKSCAENLIPECFIF